MKRFHFHGCFVGLTVLEALGPSFNHDKKKLLGRKEALYLVESIDYRCADGKKIR
jgi:hypothetical protein